MKISLIHNRVEKKKQKRAIFAKSDSIWLILERCTIMRNPNLVKAQKKTFGSKKKQKRVIFADSFKCQMKRTSTEMLASPTVSLRLQPPSPPFLEKEGTLLLFLPLDVLHMVEDYVPHLTWFSLDEFQHFEEVADSMFSLLCSQFHELKRVGTTSNEQRLMYAMIDNLIFMFRPSPRNIPLPLVAYQDLIHISKWILPPATPPATESEREAARQVHLRDTGAPVYWKLMVADERQCLPRFMCMGWSPLKPYMSITTVWLLYAKSPGPNGTANIYRWRTQLAQAYVERHGLRGLVWFLFVLVMSTPSDEMLGHEGVLRLLLHGCTGFASLRKFRDELDEVDEGLFLEDIRRSRRRLIFGGY